VQPVTGDERSDSDAKSNPPEKKKSLCQAHVMQSRAYIHAHVCMHMHTYINDLQACMQTHASMSHARTHRNTQHIHMHTFMHLYIHTYIYTHAYIHIPEPS
jgi:hypothetical protein